MNLLSSFFHNLFMAGQNKTQLNYVQTALEPSREPDATLGVEFFDESLLDEEPPAPEVE